MFYKPDVEWLKRNALKLDGVKAMPKFKEEQIGTRRVDFLVEGLISVELKAITKLEDVHLAQAINYLEAYNLEIGLLINFGETSLNFKRLTDKKYKSSESKKSN